MAPPKNFVTEISPDQSAKLKFLLNDRGWTIDSVPYSRFRARRDKTTVVVYESGKLVVQGAGTRDFVQFILEPEVLGEVRMGYDAVLAEIDRPEMFRPHAGIDESGKGDYFGPLVIAAVFVDSATSKRLVEEGITDSKKVGSDKRIAILARAIKRIVGSGWSVVPIGPSAYNRLYATIGNVNKLLAWGHARALENLLERVPTCPRAVSDQFGRKETVEKALMASGRRVRLEQYPRAETDVAVAAASILARDDFVKRLERLGKGAGLILPKGAGPKVLQAGRELIDRLGMDRLGEFAKIHFKTTGKL